MVLAILGVMWVLVLLPPWLRGRREGRPEASISSFNQRLSTLSRTRRRASRGGAFAARPAIAGPARVRNTVVVRTRAPENRAGAVRQRQRDVEFGLGGAVFILGALGLGVGLSAFTFLAGVAALAFAAYHWLVLQEQRRVELSRRIRRFPPSPAVTTGPRVAQGGGRDVFVGRREEV